MGHTDENVNNGKSLEANGGETLSKQPPPAYGKRKGFVPRNPEDFGDGGAYPECHVAQYPLGMGFNRSEDVSKSNAAAVYQNVSIWF